MPLNQDFQAPFDPTNYTSLSGAQILQLITGAFPQADKGMILVTTDVGGNPTVPNATTTTKWQNYIWLRLTATSVFLYLWNPNGANDATYLKWTNLTVNIGAGSITNAMIQDNTITDQKIASLSYSKLQGAPSNLPPSGNAGGSLTGQYPSPTIAPNAIVAAMIAAQTITGALIALNTLTNTLILGNGVANNKLRTNSAVPTNVEWYQGNDVDADTNITKTANALKLIQVNAGATAYQMQTVAQLLAQVSFTSNAAALVAGSQLINVAHGLGAVPSQVKAVLVMSATTELGYTAGDEINADSFFESSGGNENTAFQVGASATNVFCVMNSVNTVFGIHKTTGVRTQITLGNWTCKIYARL